VFTNIIRRNSVLSITAAFAIAMLGAVPARATVTYSIQSILATSPSSGNSFEVDLTNVGSAIVVSSFFFEVSVADTHFNFTSVSDGTLVNTYIFAGNSTFGPFLDDPPASGQSVLASDLWGGSGSGFSVGDGVTVALGQVFFDVAPGAAAGPYTVSFVSPGDSLSDGNGDPIKVDNAVPGTITLSVGATPEPSTLALFGVGAIALVFARKRSRI
jgi:PEP-CTERM motif